MPRAVAQATSGDPFLDRHSPGGVDDDSALMPAGARAGPVGRGARPGAERPSLGFAGAARPRRGELLAAPVRWPAPSRLLAELDLGSGKLAEGMRTLGLTSVGALLEHLPRDSRDARTVSGLQRGESATVAVQVRTIRARSVRRRAMKPLVEAVVFDETGDMRATFFNQPWLAARYPPGTRLVLHGKLTGRGAFNVAHHAVGSELGAAPGAERGDRESDGRRVAHYPASDGVSSTQILTMVRGARESLYDVPEALGASIRIGERLPRRCEALAAMHFSSLERERELARERLAFDELLLTQVAFLLRRARRRAQRGAPVLAREPSLSARWLEHELPFRLTAGQSRALASVREDLEQDRAMQRLLLGEVGSGKTVVATYALLRAVEHGGQAALMAPTETLATQHFQTLQHLLGGELAQVPCALLTGSTSPRRRDDVIGKLASGELMLVVGTHALIEPDVRFASLALAVVDEQHRFGVRQRAALDAKAPAGGAPHVLHMTATPIPRTLALANYGDLDHSVLRELPHGRKPIETRICGGEGARGRAYEQLREQLREGRQAYVVCPQIDHDASAEGSEDVRAAKAEFERLRDGELRDFRLALLHGGMRPAEKAQAMAQFASGAKDVLVATTVIEVGIDVPNATVMLIENAERFGLSQLHQLRGRVGRGEHRSHCVLMGPPGSARLRALCEHADGFALAEIDLRLRKEGELIGTRQSGVGQFEIACLPEDEQLLVRARARAEAIVAADPQLSEPEHALLADALARTFGSEATAPIPG
jgi:ATP-dependent DNA helicase RecG